MQYFILEKHTDNTEIFAGYYLSFTKCLEDAVKKQIDLTYINLKNQNLSNASLDGANMVGALLSGANLTGANLSESTLRESIFYNCSLYNTCMCYSDLEGSDFRGASFGATLIEGSNIRKSIFSTLSCFDLEFNLTENMDDCLFSTADGAMHKMSKHPIIVKGVMNKQIIVLDNAIKIGSKMFPRTILPTLMKIFGLYLKSNTTNDNIFTIGDTKILRKSS